MRVKIGDTWYDSKERPLCIEVSEAEQKQVGEMKRTEGSLGRYSSFPADSDASEAEMFNWMREG